MSRKKKADPMDVALFRYSVIGGLLSEPRGKVERQLRELSRRKWEIPGSHRTRVASGTIRGWLLAYLRGGLDALRPKDRTDSRSPRSLDPEVVEILIGLKRELPRLSVRLLIAEARARELVAPSVPLPHSTVYRMYKGEGLMDGPVGGGPGVVDRRRFAYELAGEMWQSDVLHGPRVRDHRGHARKAYLIAFLDDATRVIPHAAFAFAENTGAFLPVFRQALERRGVPKRLFVDNGSNYRSKILEIICARLGIALIHAKPYQPAGRGKIERWLKTVRQQFLPRLTPEDLRSLDALNARLREWIEGEYHRTGHHGLGGDTPLQRWARHGGEVRHIDHGMNLDDLFLLEDRRTVRKDRTVSLHNRVYEVEPRLIGQSVTLRYDPAAPPSRPIRVLHEGRPAGVATLLDLHANARVRRREPKNTLSFRDLDPDNPDTTGN